MSRLTGKPRPRTIRGVRRTFRLVVCAFAFALVGCGGGGDAAETTAAHPVSLGAIVPDFTLTDVNPASPTAGQQVSPRDYLKRGSAWYFGDAT